MKKWLVALYVVFGILYNGEVQAQNISNEGADFWAVFPTHVPNVGSPANMNIVVTSKIETEVTVSCGATYSETRLIPANTAVEFQVSRVASYIEDAEAGVPLINRGVRILVTPNRSPVSVYAHVYAGARSAATLVLPYAALGQRYYSMNYIQSSGGKNFIVLVAADNNTRILLKKRNGTTIVVNLENAGDVYEYLAPNGEDITGTFLEVDPTTSQCKRFAAFSGSTNLVINCSGGSDPLIQQLYPTNSWGKTYAVSPFFNRRYRVRVMAQEDNTSFKINGISQSVINKGQFYESGNLTAGIIVTSDKIISVAQYALTQGCSSDASGTTVGDPDMVMLNPVEFNIKNITLFSSNNLNILNKYINASIKTESKSTFMVNGAPPPNGVWVTYPSNPGYSFIQIEITHAPGQLLSSITLTANDGFNAIAYGFGSFESYAYSAGTSLASTQYFTSTNSTTNVSSNDVCVGASSTFKITLPYLLTRVVWDFADGTPNADDANPIAETSVVNGETLYTYKAPLDKTYPTVGQRTVKAIGYFPTDASNCFGSQSDFNFTFNVVPLPIALFDIVGAQVCSGSSTTFNNISSGEGNTIVKWHWDYGDGTTEIRTNANPFTRTYPVGNYPVKLFVENQAGCLSEVFSKPVRVYALPVANFTTSTLLCETKPVIFTSQSTSVDGNITAWAWDFDDGNTSAEQNPIHTYAAFGNYNVKLKVTTEFGCEKTILKQVAINPLPRVNFEIPDFCLADASAVFTNTTTIPSGEQLTYLWNFGDANSNTQRPNTSTERNGKHSYTATGVYQVTLTVTSLSNCPVVITKQFTVNGSIPKAAFEILNQNNLCSNTQVEFKDLATVDFGEVTKIEWFFDFERKTTSDFVDNQPNLRNAAAKIYSFKYPNFTDALSKTYKVKMKVYSGGSCVNEVVKMITVYPDAIPKFQLQAACLPDGKASFNNLSTYIDPNAVLIYLWDFGDENANTQNPNTSTDKDPVHNYTKAGKYNVKLSVTTPFGCETTLVKEITIEGAVPIADFNVKDAGNLCVQQPIVLEDKASLAFGSITRIDWYYDFANNPSQVETDLLPGARTSPKTYQHQYPIFSFPFSKNYVVKMVVFSGTTCINVIEKVITVYAMPDVEFVQPNPICQEVPSINLSASEKKNMPGIGKFSGNGVDAGGNFVPAIAGIGEHTITYTYTPTNGCAVVKTRVIIVNETPVVNAGEDKVVLEGGQGTLTATAFGVDLTYKWTPAAGLDRDDVLNPTVRPTEDMVYTLKVTSAKGCFALDEVKVKFLKNLVVPNAITPNGDGINDVWNIKYIDSYPTVTVEIYDRGGQRVFFSQGYGVPFDGKFNNKDLPVGTYYYLINLNTRKKPLSGTLTIIR